MLSSYFAVIPIDVCFRCAMFRGSGVAQCFGGSGSKSDH